MDPIQLSERISKNTSMFASRRQCIFGVGNDDNCATFHCSLRIAWWQQINSPDMLQKSSLASMVSQSASEVGNSAFLLIRVTRCALQRVTPRPKWRVLLPCRISRLYGGVRFVVVRDHLVSKNHLGKEVENTSGNLLIPVSLDLIVLT